MAELTDTKPRANATVKMEYKVNLGNYESCMVSEELSEVGAPGETGTDLLARLNQAVEDVLAEKVNTLRK